MKTLARHFLMNSNADSFILRLFANIRGVPLKWSGVGAVLSPGPCSAISQPVVRLAGEL